MSAVVIGSLLSILGLFGLVLAGGAIDAGMYQFGLALFGFAFLFDLWLIKSHFDAAERTARPVLQHSASVANDDSTQP